MSYCLCHLHLLLEWSDGHFSSKDSVSVVDGIGDTGENGTDTGSDPVDKVVLIFRREFKVAADAKGIPAGTQHGVHGRSSSGEEFNEGTNGNGRQELLDPVVVLSKVEFPV